MECLRNVSAEPLLSPFHRGPPPPLARSLIRLSLHSYPGQSITAGIDRLHMVAACQQQSISEQAYTIGGEGCLNAEMTTPIQHGREQHVRGRVHAAHSWTIFLFGKPSLTTYHCMGHLT